MPIEKPFSRIGLDYYGFRIGITESIQVAVWKCRESPMGRAGVVGIRLRIKQLSRNSGLRYSELKL